MGKSFPTIFTLKWLLSSMNSFVLLEVVFKFESFAAMAALKFSQVRTVCMVGHVPLKLVEGRELLTADSAGLKMNKLTSCTQASVSYGRT